MALGNGGLFNMKGSVKYFGIDISMDARSLKRKRERWYKKFSKTNKGVSFDQFVNLLKRGLIEPWN